MYDTGLLALAESGGWAALADSPNKFDRYATEALFRKSWATATDVLGEHLVPALRGCALLVLLPDALAARQAVPCMDYLTGHGFAPVAVHRFRFDRETFADMWRYQLNAATLDSLMLDELVCRKTDSILLLLRDGQTPATSTGAARLAALKGKSAPEKRTSTHLRTVLGCVNHVFVMVHCADDPLDALRELSITTTGDELADCLTALSDRPTPASVAGHIEQVAAIQDSVPAHDFDVPTAVRAVRDMIVNATPREPASGRRALAALDHAVDHHELDWRCWSQDLTALGINSTSWDVLLVATQYTRHDLPNATQLIERREPLPWLDPVPTAGAVAVVAARRR
ncbi:hypothetical protein GCM10029964_083300 [Kibdelosporangium lantanae]